MPATSRRPRRPTAPSRVPWERVEPIAELFADLDPKIDAREDDYQAGVDDPGFTGYHKLEQLLFADGTTDGTAELTAGLRANVAELRTRLETLEIDPRVMTQGAGVLIDEVAQSKMTGEEDRYSKLDLWSIDPNLEGSAKIVDILRPTLTTIDKDYLTSLDDAYASVTTIIDKYGSQSSGYKTFDQISAADLKAMQAGLANLSELLVRAVRPARAWKPEPGASLMDEAKVLSRRRFLAGSAAVGAAAVGRWRRGRTRGGGARRGRPGGPGVGHRARLHPVRRPAPGRASSCRPGRRPRRSS